MNSTFRSFFIIFSAALVLFAATPSKAAGYVSICNRSQVIQNTLVNGFDVAGCQYVTPFDVSLISSINLGNLGLTELKTGDFSGMSSMSSLWLHSNDFTQLPNGIFDDLSNLKTLLLNNNELTSLPSGIFDDLSDLTTLRLYNNELSALPNDIFTNLDSVSSLDLSNNDLATLPSDIFAGTTSLSVLWLDGNDLATLPNGIFNSTSSLSTLYLDNNQLTTLPNGIFDGTTSLRTLWLDNNNFTTLPNGIFDSTSSLSTLYLDNNQLTTLPNGIFDGSASSLKTLHLDNNLLTTLPNGIFDNLTSLINLYLDDNSLSELSSDIFDDLSALTSLRLNDNNLTQLPSGVFDSASSLKTLYLHDNEMTSLSDGVFDNLTSLTKLDLGGNELTSLSAGIFANVPLLTTLDLTHNKLTELPEGTFSGMKSLSYISFYSNTNSLPIELTSTLGDSYIPSSGSIDFTFNVVQAAPKTITYKLIADNGIFKLDGNVITTIDIPAGSSVSDNLTFVLDDGAESATIDISTSYWIPGLSFESLSQLVEATVPPKFEKTTLEYTIEQNSYIDISVINASSLNLPLTYSFTPTNANIFSSIDFDAALNRINGTISTLGEHQAAVTATDSFGDSSTLSLAFNVEAASTPSFDDSIEDMILDLGSESISVSLPIDESSGNGDLIVEFETNGAAGLPAGLTYYAASNTIQGTPTITGNFNITVVLSDSDIIEQASDESYLVFQLSISQPLLFDSVLPESGYALAWKQVIDPITLPEASGGVGELNYSLLEISGELSSGLSFDDSTRTISGTPSEVGAVTLNYTASDEEGRIISTQFNISVTKDPLLFASDLPDPSYTVDWKQAIDPIILPDAQNGVGALTYSLLTISGELSSGLSFDDSTRTISGTPSEAGSATLNYTISDEEGRIISTQFNISVTKDPLLFASDLPNPSYTLDWKQAINSITLPDAKNGVGELTYSLLTVSGVLSSGLSFDDSTRTISGTPSELGSVTLNYTITDEGNRVISTQFNLSVAHPSPDITLPQGLVFAKGEYISLYLPKPTNEELYSYKYELTYDTQDGDIDSVQMYFNSFSSHFEAFIRAKGTYTFTYTLINSQNQLTNFKFQIAIQDDAVAVVTKDILSRQSLIISEHITSSVKERMSLLGKDRAAFQQDGNKESINIILSDKSNKNSIHALSFWSNIHLTDAESNLKANDDSISWDGITTSGQVGFDVGFDNVLIGMAITDTQTDLSIGGSESGSYNINLKTYSPYMGYQGKDIEIWAAWGAGSGKATSSALLEWDPQYKLNFSMSHLGGRYHVSKGKTKISVALEQTLSSLDINEPYEYSYEGITSDASQRVVSLDASHTIKLASNAVITPSISFAARTDTLEGSDDDGYPSRKNSGQELGIALAYDYDWLSASFGTKTYSVSSEESSLSEASSWYRISVTKASKLGIGYSFGSYQGEDIDERDQLFGVTDLSHFQLDQNQENSNINFEQKLSYGWQFNRSVLSIFSSYSWDDEAFSLSNFEHKQSTWEEFGANLNSINGAINLSLSYNPNIQRTLIQGKVSIK